MLKNRILRSAVVVAVFLAFFVAPLLAHEMTVKGTVAAIEQARIQIRTGQEKAGEQPAWYPLDRTTSIKRGNKTVKRDDANIKVDERVVAIVDHPDKGPVKTKEIRLAKE